jgi:hypothetical protein
MVHFKSKNRLDDDAAGADFIRFALNLDELKVLPKYLSLLRYLSY